MFKIEEFTEAHVASITNRVEKHGDDEKPAVSMSLELTVANSLLDNIDPTLRHALYKAKDEGMQQDLPDVEQTTPVLRCNSIDRVTLPTKHEGWTLAVDDGIDDTQPMLFGGVKADKLSVEPKQGGSVVLRFRVGTSDVDADKLGKLAMHNGQSVWIKLTPPAPKAEAIDGSKEAFDRDHPDATDLFVESQGGEDAEGGDESGEDARDEQTDVTGSDEPWPFPKNATTDPVPQGATIEDAPRARRGRKATAAVE